MIAKAPANAVFCTTGNKVAAFMTAMSRSLQLSFNNRVDNHRENKVREEEM
jgi:hypothetical protein